MEEDKKKRKNKNKKKKNKQTKGIENNAVGSEESASSIQNHAAELRGTEAHTDDTSGVDEDPSRHVTDGAKIVRNLFSCIKSRPANDDDDSAHNVELAGGNVCLITKKESWDKKLADANKEGKIVIANFSASWCGPCRMIAPFYSELSEKYPSLMFLTVDVDELTEFSSCWDIKATPTFFFLKDSQQIDKLVGANKPELQKKITAIADSLIVCETQLQ